MRRIRVFLVALMIGLFCIWLTASLAFNLAADQPGHVTFFGSDTADLFTKEVDESFKGVLTLDYVSKPDGTETRQSSSDGSIMTRYFWGRNCQAWPDYLCAVDYHGFTSRQFGSPPNRPFAIWNSLPVSLLTSPISYCARYLGAVETPTSGSITLYVNNTQPHQLALYVCDFDKMGREEIIELRDLKGHLLTAPCTVGNFEEGKWLRFRFSGSIQIRLINQNKESTAVLSALMFNKVP